MTLLCNIGGNFLFKFLWPSQNMWILATSPQRARTWKELSLFLFKIRASVLMFWILLWLMNFAPAKKYYITIKPMTFGVYLECYSLTSATSEDARMFLYTTATTDCAFYPQSHKMSLNKKNLPRSRTLGTFIIFLCFVKKIGMCRKIFKNVLVK